MKMKIMTILLSLIFTAPEYSYSALGLKIDAGRLHHAHISFKVYSGDCKDCRKSIEKVVSKLPGVESVEFNLRRNMLTVVYDPIEITPKGIKEQVSKAGFDTDTTKATKEAYDKIPDCCKYDRKS